MKVKIGPAGAHHRISSGLTQSFAADAEIDLPRETAEALIEAGKAEKIAGQSRAKNRESEE